VGSNNEESSGTTSILQRPTGTWSRASSDVTNFTAFYLGQF